MATISNTPRPGYVWDSADNVWYPIGVGAHQHTNAADTPAVMPYSTYAAAGKNKILNGDFGIWQRGTSITVPTATTTYTTDRFYAYSDHSSGTASVSRQTFTPGTAPVSGYEGSYFARWTQGTGATYWELAQKIEDVRTFAGQTVTFSFWAKASASASINLLISQIFGSGGSSAVTVSSTASITTSWARYSATLNVPSISGKTIGTNSNLQVYINQSTPVNTLQIDTWGWQVEAGSTVTAFQTATGNPASELAACQRYYWRSPFESTYTILGTGSAYSTANSRIFIPLLVQMRTQPSTLDYGGTTPFSLYDGTNVIGPFAGTGLTLENGFLSSSKGAALTVVPGGTPLTAFRPYFLILNGSGNSSQYIGFGAEL